MLSCTFHIILLHVFVFIVFALKICNYYVTFTAFCAVLCVYPCLLLFVINAAILFFEVINVGFCLLIHFKNKNCIYVLKKVLVSFSDLLEFRFFSNKTSLFTLIILHNMYVYRTYLHNAYVL